MNEIAKITIMQTNHATEPRPLINREQVAKMLGVNYHTVLRLESRGLLPCVRLGHRFIRYRVEDVDHLISEMTTGTRVIR